MISEPDPTEVIPTSSPPVAPTSSVGIVGAGMLLLGPLAWGFIRQTRGLPAFDNNAAAWRVPDRDK
jgi:hypothetical protein